MTNKEYEQEINKYINRLKILRKKGISIAAGIIGTNLFMEDLYFIASADRSINLIDGIIQMFLNRNLTCVGVLLRMQMDNCLRSYAAFIAENKDEVVKCIISGDKINNKKDKNGKKMNDGYLKEQIAKIDPNFPKVYNQVCGYVHLSSKAFYQTIDKLEGEEFAFQVGLPLPERRNPYLIEAAEAFEHYVKLHYKMLIAVAESKSKFDSQYNDL